MSDYGELVCMVWGGWRLVGFRFVLEVDILFGWIE